MVAADSKNLIIPESIQELKYYVFYGCSGLTAVVIPNSVTYIGGSAFSGCSSLTSVEIPNSVTSIDYAAFSGCSGLYLEPSKQPQITKNIWR